jgi:hypothetical protein
MTDLSSIAEKLAKFVRLLASDKDGEVVAAARSIDRVLKSIGADFHDLAERVEHKTGALSQAEMEQIYNAGIKEGIRQEKQARAVAIRSNGPLDFPSAQDMAMHCYQKITSLKSEWEVEFVTNMAAWTRTPRPLSPKQQAHLEKIFIKLGGRI